MLSPHAPFVVTIVAHHAQIMRIQGKLQPQISLNVTLKKGKSLLIPEIYEVRYQREVEIRKKHLLPDIYG
jgi:hypothetical protein